VSKTVENVDQVKELALKNSCEAAGILGILFGSFKRILRDNLKVHWIAAKFVPLL
jgi:hypothetical protein